MFNRVNGNLALSRALGDYIFKKNDQKKLDEQIVIGELLTMFLLNIILLNLDNVYKINSYLIIYFIDIINIIKLKS